jgi:hypothetical protein
LRTINGVKETFDVQVCFMVMCYKGTTLETDSNELQWMFWHPNNYFSYHIESTNSSLKIQFSKRLSKVLWCIGEKENGGVIYHSIMLTEQKYSDYTKTSLFWKNNTKFKRRFQPRYPLAPTKARSKFIATFRTGKIMVNKLRIDLTESPLLIITTPTSSILRKYDQTNR